MDLSPALEGIDPGHSHGSDLVAELTASCPDSGPLSTPIPEELAQVAHGCLPLDGRQLDDADTRSTQQFRMRNELLNWSLCDRQPSRRIPTSVTPRRRWE